MDTPDKDQVNPPTEQQRKWTLENFSSRVLPELPKEEVCVLGPVITDYDMIVRGMVVSIVYGNHSLVDVPFED